MIGLLCAFMPFAHASAGTKYESESNNTAATADQTADDYDNYGALSSASDSDWWTVTFPSAGQGNFWLGNIASGKDYDLYLYDNEGNLLDYSYDRGAQKQEIIKYDIVAGATFKIEICSLAGDYSSQQYLFRTKFYTAPKSSLFTFNYTETDGSTYNSRPTATYSLQHLWDMGYTGQEYLNNSASSAYGAFKTSDIFVIRNHAVAGKISFVNSSGTTSYLYGKSSSSTATAILNYADSALSGNELAIFSGCYTGKTSSTYGNLVDAALQKGSKCAIGWLSYSYTSAANQWVGEFFEWCSKGAKISEAMAKADALIKAGNFTATNGRDVYTDMKNRHTGTSDLTQIIG